MKTIQINTGLQPIGINSWGAIERCIFYYDSYLKKKGVVSEILYPNDVLNNKDQIVHVHIANQALMLAKRNIPYIFSFHDHTACLLPKTSQAYLDNLEAINKSVITLVPAEYLIEFWGNPYKVFYFPHGVDTEYFKPSPVDKKLSLCNVLVLANNGLCYDPLFDRKGFRLAIEAAQELNLPITVAGPTNNNKLFFDANPDLKSYKNLTIQYDLNQKELLDAYHSHDVFLHPSYIEAGQPCLTILEALACGLPVIGTYEGSRNLSGFLRVNRSKEEIIDALKEFLVNPDYYKRQALSIRETHNYEITTNNLIKIYKAVLSVKENFDTDKFTNQLWQTYDKTTILNKKELPTKEDEIFLNFINGAFIEIKGNSNKTYHVEFVNRDNNQSVYSSVLTPNHWSKVNIAYFINYEVRIKDENYKLIQRHVFDLYNKNVLFSFESSSLGDTIAWFPAIEEFQRKHNCRVFVSTFWNQLFEKEYSRYTFVKPGATVNHIYAQYNLGLFIKDNQIDNFKHPTDPRLIPLQKIAYDILGLNFKESRPQITINNKERPIIGKYVCIFPNSTAQCKYWNYENGWQKIINFLNNRGYQVVLLQKEEKTDLIGVVTLKDKNIDLSIQYIFHSDFCIGVSTGLSWLAFALKKKAILISGITKFWNEFQDNCVHIGPQSHICNSCFNNPDFIFGEKEKGNWNLCFAHENTSKQFECTKTIKPEKVTQEINRLIEKTV